MHSFFEKALFPSGSMPLFLHQASYEEKTSVLVFPTIEAALEFVPSRKARTESLSLMMSFAIF